MSDVLIQPLRSYEDRGVIRTAKQEPYSAPERLARMFEARGLARIVEAKPPAEPRKPRKSTKGAASEPDTD